MIGLLNLNKPVGATSRDAVNRVQRVLRQLARERGDKPAKVGHAGTLDPIAQGVLVVCVGQATRLIEHVQRQSKEYQATFLLGRTSPSDDTELPAEPIPNAPVPGQAEIERALGPLTGSIQQKPPVFSAIKVRGEKAYDLARAGRPPDLPPRPVEVYSLRVTRYEYPGLELHIRCGSGTYVRALGRDLARSLGTGAVMAGLVRTAIGPFEIDRAIDPNTLTTENLSAALAPPGLAVAGLPRVEVTAAEVEELRHGRFLGGEGRPAGPELAAFGPSGDLVALLTKHPQGKLRPTHVFQ